jgi:hypothetical protein
MLFSRVIEGMGEAYHQTCMAEWSGDGARFAGNIGDAKWLDQICEIACANIELGIPFWYIRSQE